METLNEAEISGEPERRQRACLRCTTTFSSAWVGERVCPRCKGSSTWRNGGVAEVRRTQSRSTPSGRS